MIVNYETNSFSIHQAIHTSDPIGNVSLVTIPRDSVTTLSGQPQSNPSKKLSTGAIVGIVVGAVIGIAILALLAFFLGRRRRSGSDTSSEDEKTSAGGRQRSMLDRLLGRRSHLLAQEPTSNHQHATEVGADASHERFELPAPLGPAELDSESGTWDGTTENGSTQDSSNMSAYERARRKLERQQAIGIAQRMGNMPPSEKTENDISPIAHYRPQDVDTPLVSPIAPDSGSLSMSQPSPMSPNFPPQDTGAPPTYRRINPANVVYAGRLPDNVALPSIVPKVVGRDGRTIRSEPSDPTVSSPTDPHASDSLGSNFTDNQDAGTADLYGSNNTPSAVSPITNGTGSGGNSGSGQRGAIRAKEPREDAALRELLDPMGSQRRLDGEDLIHIPQPAENRFSFEEERISGNENTR